MKILVLATGTQSQLTKAIEAAGHTYEVHDPRALYLYVSESENGYDRLYNGLASLEKPVRIRAKDFDAVVSRIGNGLEYGANILTHLNENLGIYTVQTGAGLLTASNKLRTTMKLSSHGIRVPRTIGAFSPLHPDFLVEKVGGLPSVAKTLTGSQGKGVIILKDAEQTNTTLEAFWRAETPLKLQQYIEGGKTDIRAIVVGDRVVSAMERTGAKDFRANLSQGGSGRKVTLTDQQAQMCVKASQALGLEFSGVDIMLDQDGKAFVIEVNGNPGTKIIQVTGHNHFKDLVQHIESKVQKDKPESLTTTAIKVVTSFLGIEPKQTASQTTILSAIGYDPTNIQAEDDIEPENDQNKVYKNMDELETLTSDRLTRHEAMAFMKMDNYTKKIPPHIYHEHFEYRFKDSVFWFFNFAANIKKYPNLCKWTKITVKKGFKIKD
jgi:ribosomal protein S6--L-glutamate ligase